MIYLDNAATSLHRPPEVAAAAAAAMQRLGNPGRGVNGGSLSAARTVYGAREKAAAFFGCGSPSRVCFTQNVTEALNIALFGLLGPGDHVISTEAEHNSVLRPLYRLRELGTEVTLLPADRQGRVSFDNLADAVKPNTKAIVCAHASNLTGNLAGLGAAAETAKRFGLTLIVDAAQTAGSFPIEMEKMGISVLCFTGHKGLMGPQGTGGLCLAPGVEIRPLLFGGTGVQTFLETQPAEYPTRLEAGTLNSHGLAGLSAAFDFLNRTGVETIHAHEDALARRFYEAVREIPSVRVYGDFSGPRAPIVSLNVGNLDSGTVSDFLSTEYGIAVRSGAHCAPLLHRALGTAGQGAVRFSFGWFNTEKDADTAAEAVLACARD